MNLERSVIRRSQLWCLQPVLDNEDRGESIRSDDGDPGCYQDPVVPPEIPAGDTLGVYAQGDEESC